MENQKPNAELVWKQFEDVLVPRLNPGLVGRAVYSHLVRHSRLEGKLQLRFSIAWLTHGTTFLPALPAEPCAASRISALCG